jgi:hypothetical protein
MEAQAREIESYTLNHKCHLAYAKQYNARKDANKPEGEKRGREEEMFKARKLGSAYRNEGTILRVRRLVALWKVEFKTGSTHIKKYRPFVKGSD